MWLAGLRVGEGDYARGASTSRETKSVGINLVPYRGTVLLQALRTGSRLRARAQPARATCAQAPRRAGAQACPMGALTCGSRGREGRQEWPCI